MCIFLSPPIWLPVPIGNRIQKETPTFCTVVKQDEYFCPTLTCLLNLVMIFRFSHFFV